MNVISKVIYISMVACGMIGKYLVLMYFLVIFTSMLSNSQYWRLKLLYIFYQISLVFNKITGLIFPIAMNTIE